MITEYSLMNYLIYKSLLFDNFYETSKEIKTFTICINDYANARDKKIFFE